ncbi:hypothetical protein AWZ03_009835 [Drosophila navojoa]|uniref:Uncharacterized protein n=1 Tax=Drosophila navojoa TaxID=7232 RepID=A0A484B4Q3_DRONA|nr:hypothetical protein AWZ03_009835 [Drosophila navojoa]
MVRSPRLSTPELFLYSSKRICGPQVCAYLAAPSALPLSLTLLPANPRPIIIINSQQNGPNFNVECQQQQQQGKVEEEEQQQQQQASVPEKLVANTF